MEKRGIFDSLKNFLMMGKVYESPFAEISKLKVHDLMTKDVITIPQDRKLSEATQTMVGGHISCVVVVKDHKPIGIITERDFVKKLNMEKEPKSNLLVSDIMTKNLIMGNPGMDLFEISKIMRTNNFRKLVISQDGELAGIITQTDLCRVVAKMSTPIINPPTVEDIMTKKVVTVQKNESFLSVKKLMSQKDMGSVIVNDGDEIAGVFTEFDIVSEYFMNPNKLKKSLISDIMNTPVVCIAHDFNLTFINKLMIEKNFRRLPVMKNGRIVGIVTQTDVARKLYEFLETTKNTKLSNWEREVMLTEEPKITKKRDVILYERREG